MNSVKVSWGPEDARDEATHTVPESIAEPWGLRHISVDTECASEADAELLAALILARRAWPFWGTPESLVYGHLVDSESERLMALLDVSTAVLAPFQPTPGVVPSGLAPGTVEGWVETWDDRHTWQVALSDTSRWVTLRARTYSEVAALGTYAAVLAQGSYLDVLTTEGVA